MKKQWFNIMMKCVKDSPSITAKVGEKNSGWKNQR